MSLILNNFAVHNNLLNRQIRQNVIGIHLNQFYILRAILRHFHLNVDTYRIICTL